MARRTPNPATERAAQNAQTIKSLLKLEENKMCADCKRNKHPRWASWNIGVFICIRCSGIHRGMGTHISRVKSVDLDAWTDEQLQNILKWGNLKANKYWESKLAADHLPSEAKIENFIRTKYESKRWVMEGPIPDPSTLSVDGDDDLPLSLVKEKQSRERFDAQKVKSSLLEDPSQNQRIQQPDLFKNDTSIYTRETLTNSRKSSISQKADNLSSKQTKPVDTLLGLDFFGTGNALPCRSSSATSMAGVQSRPDLKQSILSLYAAAPRPPQQQTINSPPGTFGSLQSSTQKIHVENVRNAFESLSFSSPSPSAQNQSSLVFTDLGMVSNQKNNISHVSLPVGRGSFFENKSISKSVPPQTSSATHSSSNSTGFGAFNSSPVSSTTMSTTNSSALGNILDFTAAAPLASEAASNISSPPIQKNSVFNLSEPSSQKIPLSSPKSVSILANSDAWSSNDTWANPGKGSSIKQQISPQASIEESGWGNLSSSSINNSRTLQGGESRIGSLEAHANPIVSSDEEFGSWGSAPAATPVATTVLNKPAAGFAGNDDLFSNVWG